MLIARPITWWRIVAWSVVGLGVVLVLLAAEALGGRGTAKALLTAVALLGLGFLLFYAGHSKGYREGRMLALRDSTRCFAARHVFNNVLEGECCQCGMLIAFQADER